MVAGRLCPILSAGVLFGCSLWGPAQSAGGLPGAFAACLDYHCDLTSTIRLSQEQWRAVRAEFADVQDARAERQAVRRAIARMEDQVGRITGTWQDLARNRAGAGLPGQLDCISESRNTTTYLELMARDDLLRWHTVEARTQRTLWLIVAHWTAVIRDKATGQRYAVDSWFLDNGQPPFIQPLEHWQRGENFADNR